MASTPSTSSANLQIYTRGEDVYQCDVCKRKVRVPANNYSINIIQRCIITYGCKGKLHKASQASEINSTPAIPPEVSGVQDWFQRKVLFTYTQAIKSTTWAIQHDLAGKPVVQTFVYEQSGDTQVLTEVTPKSITVIDLNNIEVEFDQPQSGIAQCIALASANAVNPNITSTPTSTVPTTDTQITSGGELTIATLDTSTLIDLTVQYISPTTTTPLTIQYVGVDDNPSIDSAWVGTNRVFVGGKPYIVRSFNLLTHEVAPAYFNNHLVANGSPFYFQGLTGTPGQNLILLSNSPFSTVDRVYDRYIDLGFVSTTQPELYYTTGEAFAEPSIIRTIYPPVFVVD